LSLVQHEQHFIIQKWWCRATKVWCCLHFSGSSQYDKRSDSKWLASFKTSCAYMQNSVKKSLSNKQQQKVLHNT
jgi:hypothetical protein